MNWIKKLFKPKPKPVEITATNFWDTDLSEIDRQLLPKGVKITDLPIAHHINGMSINKIKR